MSFKQREEEKGNFTISRWRNISCFSRFGFNPSTSWSSFSSASKNWGFEIINGAATQGYLKVEIEIYFMQWTKKKGWRKIIN